MTSIKERAFKMQPAANMGKHSNQVERKNECGKQRQKQRSAKMSLSPFASNAGRNRQL